MSVKYYEQNNIGYVEFDLADSKVNLLSAVVIKELDKVLDDVRSKTGVDAIAFISKKDNVFIAGADISEIEKITDPKDGREKAKAGQDVFNKIEDLKVPTVAVIDGVALGGGCELALACNYRLATFNEKVRIGLPEVNLGFVPGFGGTYRLPRLVGLAESLKMILSGKPVDSAKAFRSGLVDRVVPSVELEHFIKEFIEDIKNKNIGKRKKKKGIPGFLDSSLIGQWIIFSQSRKNVLKLSKGFYPAPLRAIDVIKANLYTDRTKGLAIESKAFGELAITDISKNLVQVFYMSENFKKLTVEGADDIKPTAISKCGILGAGVMGGGIAQLLGSRDIWCRLKDINHEALASGLSAAAKVFKGAVKRRRLSKAEAEMKMGHITSSLNYSGFADSDIVIEAVVEKMEVKKKVFKELSEVTNGNTILASNTSALSVTEILCG